jgi:hypothetical protein
MRDDERRGRELLQALRVAPRRSIGMRPAAAGVFVCGLVVALPAAAAPPPGHPSLAPPSSSALPPGHPSVGGGPSGEDSPDATPDRSNMPAGHPAMGDGEPAKDSVAAAPDLGPGAVEVHVADAAERPVGNAAVRLGIMRHDVAAGDSREERVVTTDPSGTATFRGLPIGTEYSFRATVRQGEGAYSSEPFRLDERTGQRVLLHVYPVTRDIRQAMVGMRGVVYVQPREDIFQVEVTFQVLNIGPVAWVPADVRIRLPEGAKAFRATESMNDTVAERDKEGDVTLRGTFGPGQRDVAFQYQLENLHEPAQRFRMGLPPHVAEMRVFAEGPREMRLAVSGYPPAERTTAQSGGHLLVTGKRAVRGDSPLDAVDVSLENLPVPAQGRWYAAFLAFGFAAFGVWTGFIRKPSTPESTARRSELSEAEDLIFRELVALERLEREGAIGPRAYAEARTELLDVLSRLASQAGSPAAS